MSIECICLFPRDLCPICENDACPACRQAAGRDTPVEPDQIQIGPVAAERLHREMQAAAGAESWEELAADVLAAALEYGAQPSRMMAAKLCLAAGHYARARGVLAPPPPPSRRSRR